MKNILFGFTLCILSSLTASAQRQISLNLDEVQLKIHAFIQDNLDSVQKYTTAETLYLYISYPDQTFVPSYLEFHNEYKKNDQTKVEVWPPLRKYIKNIFDFFPDYQTRNSVGKDYTFQLTCKKISPQEIKKSLDRFKPNSFNVPPNSNYKLLIDTIYALHGNIHFPVSVNKMVIESKLDYLNSDLIKLSDRAYLKFRVSNTSFDGLGTSEVELFLYCKNCGIENNILFTKTVAHSIYTEENSIRFETKSSSDGEVLEEIKIRLDFLK